MDMEDLFPFESPTTRSILKKFLSDNPENQKNDRHIATSCLLEKAIIICSLKNGMACGYISEDILDSLLIIEQLDRGQGLPVLDSMKDAFCAVTIHCTVSLLCRSWLCYFHAVKRIWKLRIQKLLDSGTTLLIGPDLIKWRVDIEAALWDSDLSQRLLQINTRSAALQSLRLYLEEAFSMMKPDLLQISWPSPTADKPNATAPSIDKEKGKVSVSHTNLDAGEGSSSSKNTNLEAGEVSSSSKNNLSTNEVTKVRESSSKNANLEAGEVSPSSKNNLSTAEVIKVRDSLKSSTADLVAAVTDPLPEALAVAERVAFELKMKSLQAKALEEHDNNKDISNPPMKPIQYGGLAPDVTREIFQNEAMADENRNNGKNIPSSSVKRSVILHDETMEDEHSKDGENIPSPSEPYEETAQAMKCNQQEHTSIHQNCGGNIPSPSLEPSTEPAQAKKGNPQKQVSIHQNKPSLMDRNNTAHTYEWEDSIEMSLGSTPSPSRCSLPSPKITRVSPLRPYKPKKETRRRKRNMWTIEEENALLEGVKKFGSDWSWILKSNPDAFNMRTPVDLKDKWRNMRG